MAGVFSKLFERAGAAALASAQKSGAGKISPSKDREPEGYPVGLVGERNYQRAIVACREGERVTLVHEPGNPYDNRAIAAVCPRGKTLGYLARGSGLTSALLEERKGCAATILRIADGEGEHLGVVLDLQLNGAPIGQRPFAKR